MKTCFPKVRSRIERAFFAWYAEHQDAFLRPLVLARRTDGNLSFTMPGLNPNLGINLHTWEFCLYASGQDQDWDRVIAFNAYPELTNQGYYDTFTQPGYCIFYNRRELLWQAEMFDPFMNWLNNKLMSAKWLGLYGAKGSCIWAELIAEPDPEALVSLPVWLDKIDSTN